MLDRLVPLLMPLVTRDIGAAARQVGRDGILYAAMAFLGLTGFALVVAGSVVWLSSLIGIGPALLAVAGAIMLPIPIILGLMAAWHRAEKKRKEQDAVAELIRLGVTALVPVLLRSPGTFMMVAAGIIAFMILMPDKQEEKDQGPA
ncbi:hypothetical protein [Niveispirillum sp. KHB5.9]|uniref:hypothetical protein n=1 Tax=Niveispirillum sp. KHB5.9 TaxID=3400269 RepID=UPI003A888467